MQRNIRQIKKNWSVGRKISIFFFFFFMLCFLTATEFILVLYTCIYLRYSERTNSYRDQKFGVYSGELQNAPVTFSSFFSLFFSQYFLLLNIFFLGNVESARENEYFEQVSIFLTSQPALSCSVYTYTVHEYVCYSWLGTYHVFFLNCSRLRLPRN